MYTRWGEIPRDFAEYLEQSTYHWIDTIRLDAGLSVLNLELFQIVRSHVSSAER